jgi:hypothetical protein
MSRRAASPAGRWLIVRRDGARRLACSHSVVLKEPVDGSRSYPRGDSNPQSHRVWAGGMCLFCYSGWWAAREGVEPPHRAVTGRRTAGCATWHRCSPAARSRQRNHEQTQRRIDLHGVRRPIHTSQQGTSTGYSCSYLIRNCSGVGLTGLVIAVVTGRRAGLAQPSRTGRSPSKRL